MYMHMYAHVSDLTVNGAEEVCQSNCTLTKFLLEGGGGGRGEGGGGRGRRMEKEENKINSHVHVHVLWH